MRVAVVSHGIFPDAFGGMERHTFNLCCSLTTAGIQTEAIVPAPSRGTHFPFPIRYLPWPKSVPWLLGHYQFSRHAAEEVSKINPDVAFGQGFGLWAYLSKRHAPCVYHPHGLEMFGQAQNALERIQSRPFQWLARYHGRHSDAVISLGGKLTDLLVNKVLVPRQRIVEIPNAVAENFEAKAGSDERMANSFLFVGRLVFNKGVDLLVKALERLKGHSLSLTIVGDGPLRKEVERLAKRDVRVHFRGPLTDAELQHEYRTHECLLFTSRFEGMPTVILEAMAQGCGVVATRIGAVETMVDSQSGILIEPSSESVVDAITKYLRLTVDQRRKMGQIGQQRVTERFTWHTVTAQFLELFKHLVRTRSMSPNNQSTTVFG